MVLMALPRLTLRLPSPWIASRAALIAVTEAIAFRPMQDLDETADGSQVRSSARHQRRVIQIVLVSVYCSRASMPLSRPPNPDWR